jgi:hypothetical protein
MPERRRGLRAGARHGNIEICVPAYRCTAQPRHTRGIGNKDIRRRGLAECERRTKDEKREDEAFHDALLEIK